MKSFEFRVQNLELKELNFKKQLIIWVFLLLLILNSLFLPLNSVFARITPADIVNEQLDTYNQKLKTYTPQTQQKIINYNQQIAALNKQITDDWEANMVRQGQILDEYVYRNNLQENGGKDGIHRNLSQPVENARYWLTYAHEAVAYQAGKVYVMNLTSESTVNSDILNTINTLQADTSVLKNKVLKSQQLIEALVKQ